MHNLKPYLQLLLEKPSLSRDEARAAMQIIVNEANPEQTAAFLAIMKYRGEHADEVAGMLEALESQAKLITFPFSVIDIVGTGGDMANTVNISTGSAILTAACGLPVVKHGNRAVSSLCGSADVLEEFGVELELPAEAMRCCLDQVKIAFLYAPNYHPALKKIRPIRKNMLLPTLFNLLPPLLNPAKAEYILLGVAHESSLQLVSEVILRMKHIKHALVFHGNGLDELTPLGPVQAFEIKDGKKQKIAIDPVSLGFSRCTLDDLKGGDAVTNARLLKQAFAGEISPIADALIFTAGAALMVYGAVSSLVEGVDLAREVLQQGRALETLQNWVAFTQMYKKRSIAS